mmetsp:Transcript_69193/g.174751  ORF Transcript_69193/g.174751 Transcript_69193/m.174751 type:complete len:312 (+) Transcript_69193:983-1918(+)
MHPPLELFAEHADDVEEGVVVKTEADTFLHGLASRGTALREEQAALAEVVPAAKGAEHGVTLFDNDRAALDEEEVLRGVVLFHNDLARREVAPLQAADDSVDLLLGQVLEQEDVCEHLFDLVHPDHGGDWLAEGGDGIGVRDPVHPHMRQRDGVRGHVDALQQLGLLAVAHAVGQHPLGERPGVDPGAAEDEIALLTERALQPLRDGDLTVDHDDELRGIPGRGDDLAGLELAILRGTDEAVLLFLGEVPEEFPLLRLTRQTVQQILEGATPEHILHAVGELTQGAPCQRQASNGAFGTGTRGLPLAVDEP